MKNFKLKLLGGTLAALLAANAQASNISIINSFDANTLANEIAGTGITITNATYSGASLTASGIFSGALADGLGIDSGIVLTTGTTNCVPGPNNSSSCSSPAASTSLSFDFTTSTGDLFFNYQFGSEEYNEYVGSSFNDTFQLLLNGTNIATLPGSGGVVSINNVNNSSNSAYYIDNTGSGNPIDLQYDGFTTLLTASATGLTIGQTYSFAFNIFDVGDSSLDSGVFIESGTFSGVSPVPEPATLTLFGLGLLGLGLRRRRKV